MTLTPLYQRLERMPMLRALLPLAFGILCAEGYCWPLWFLVGGMVLAIAVAWRMHSSGWMFAALFLLGVSMAQLRAPQSTPPTNLPTDFELILSGIPADRGRYHSVEAEVRAWRDAEHGVWIPTQGRVLLWADSALHVGAGERIRCFGAVRPLHSGPESFQRLMARRGVVGSLWISARRVVDRQPDFQTTLHQRAARRLAQLPISPDAQALCRAMTSGDRSAVSAELRDAYARSGLAHLLALSGLHVGILFVLVNLLLWWVPLLRRGHLLRNILAVLCIWLYVVVAGFPPSAVRAAVIFSALQFALASGSAYVSGNALAAAAFGMLLWKPTLLGDISFQLSFVAVTAILAWGIPLMRWFRCRWRWLNVITGGVVVSVVATLAVAPLTAHSFGFVSFAGVLLTPVAILLAGVVVFGGVVWLVLPFGVLAPVVGFAIEQAAEAMNAMARWGATLPATVEYPLSSVQAITIYLFFVAVTIVWWCFEPKKSVHLLSK